MVDEHAPFDTESRLRRLVDMVNSAKTLPMSNTVRLTRDEILDQLSEALERLPDELRQARWMLKERAEFLAKTQREAGDILEQARVRAEHMVQRTEIVREATHTAQRLVGEASEESSRLRMEAEDYCDQKLASFEIVLERTIRTVQAGREKLRVAPMPVGGSLAPGDAIDLRAEPARPQGGLARPQGGVADASEEAFFDQDIR